MKTSKEAYRKKRGFVALNKTERTRICCSKCGGFLFEVRPFLSPLQEVKAFCRKCNSKVVGVRG